MNSLISVDDLLFSLNNTVCFHGEDYGFWTTMELFCIREIISGFED